MNPENPFTADRDAGSVNLRDTGRVMAAPAEFFSMFCYSVASFGGEVPVLLREIGEAWGEADTERFGGGAVPAEDLPIGQFSVACSERMAERGFGPISIEEIEAAAVVGLEAPPPQAAELLAGWFSSVLTRLAGFPLACQQREADSGPRVALDVVPAEQEENAE